MIDNVDKDNIPVFFVHTGMKEYLWYTIKQAEATNRIVYLLGDEDNKNVASNWRPLEQYITKEFMDFKNCYQHMSSNPYEFELNCFKRFFVAYEFAKRNKVEKFMMLDSDLLAYVNFSEIDFGTAVAALSIPESQSNYLWTASPHCSYWTLSAIREFLDFVSYEYSDGIAELKEKWKYHQSNHIQGGICDMTLLYLWSQRQIHDIYNTTKVIHQSVFDHFLSISEGYSTGTFKMRPFCEMKVLKFVEDIPYFKSQNGEWIRALTIHAQGKSKMYIKLLYDKKSSSVQYSLAKLSTYGNRLLRKVKTKL